MKPLVENMKELKEDQVLSRVKELNEQGVEALDILQGLQEGVGLVGEEFEAGNYFLSELIMSGIIFRKAMDMIKDRLSQSQGETEFGTFVIGTVKNDIHDIGCYRNVRDLYCRFLIYFPGQSKVVLSTSGIYSSLCLGLAQK